MKLCDYGCGQEAKYQFKNRKWCCREKYNSCPNMKQMVKNRLSKHNPLVGRKRSQQYKEYMRKINTGKNNPRYGKTHTEEWKKSQSEKLKGRESYHKLTLKIINERYLFFCKIEEIRNKPNNRYTIQAHCKNHECKNSKEKGGWFTLTYSQLYERIRHLEKDYGNGGCYFYCSQECKNDCILYNVKSDPNKETPKKSYTQEEYQIFRTHALTRDNYKCQYCGEQAEHVHHERPQKLEPFFALDPDLAWSVCKKCHYKYGHKDECNTWAIANRVC